MRFSKVLLINPPSRGELGASRPPSGLGYISQVLIYNGIDNEVLDIRLGYQWKHLQEKIERFKPELIGMTLFSLEYKRAYDLLTRIKNDYPEIKLIVGGPHVTTLREQVLDDCKVIDYGVVFEGEQTVTELCKENVSEDKIKGLLIRNNGKVIYNGDRPFIEDIDTIPMPLYEKFELNKYIPERIIISTRGCPFRCVYCPNRIITQRFRVRSAVNVVDEIEYWYKKGYRQFNFDDDNFTIKKKRVYDVCNEIEKRGLKNLFLRCSNGVRADSVDRALLVRMKEVGFSNLAFGVEAGNNRILKLLKKGESIETIEQAIKDSCELGYDVLLFFLVGSPGETTADVEDSIRLALRYPIQRANFYNLIPYPKTELFDWIKQNNYFLSKPEDYLNDTDKFSCLPVFETPEMPKEERIKLLKRVRKIEKQITSRAVSRMFSKIPILGTLAGFIFSSGIFQRLLFQNMSLRKIVEKIRYRYKLAVNK